MVVSLVATAVLVVGLFVWPEVPYQLADMLSQSLTAAPAEGLTMIPSVR
jgi:hypothetical protein